VKSDDLLAILREFHREKLTLRQRHVAVARHVTDYTFNNTYQYVIAREDVHLQWLEAALQDLGETPQDLPEPALPAPGRKEGFTPLVAEDAKSAAQFAERWRPRVAGLTQARHRTMMQVVIGETLEHQRFFEQIGAGNLNVLGRRANGPKLSGTPGRVLPERWQG
jgi:Mn-containing catalase